METALINSAVGILVGKLNTMIEENMKLRSGLTRDLHDIKCEIDTINGAILKYGESNDHMRWIRELQDLALDMEDKIDEFTGRVTCSAESCWFNRKLVHPAQTTLAHIKLAKDLQDLKESAKEACSRRKRYSDNTAPPALCTEPVAVGTSSSSSPYIPEGDLVGIAEPKEKLLELLEATTQGEVAEQRLRVISIFGHGGIGKTTLAKVVFDSPEYGKRFPYRAWVVASECKDAKELLADILFKLRGGTKDTTSSLAQLGENISTYLQENRRYFIVIDDMQTEVWADTKSSFPMNTNGRVIVTTSIQSIANTCSSNRAYLYRMQPLNADHSKALLLKEIFGSETRGLPDYESILKKCEGLPLALVNIAQLLKPKSEGLKRDHCNKVCEDLRSHLQNDQALSRMKQVLIHTYDNLPGHDLKTFLLFVSIFPNDHPIKRKSLVRRWLAEGLVIKDVRPNRENVAHEYFEELVNRSIIQPVLTSTNAEVKTCRVHSIVLDFIVHKSFSHNFITIIHDNELIMKRESSCAVRRVSLDNRTAADGAKLDINLSRIRSLTILGHVAGYVKFHKCKFLRVLDLENCKQLEDSDIQNICRLLRLKYLSLRGTKVNKIPRKISNLHYLETLDMRNTKVSILPIEVLTLPRLAHLLGQFKLPCKLNKVKKGHKLLTFFSQKSELQTLSGFVMDENNGFQHIMIHTRKLKKVKIWSEGTPSSNSIDVLKTSLQNRFYGNDALQSLSVDFGDHSIDFLDSLNPPCLLTSLKLHGTLAKLPDFIKSLKDLELHLSSTTLSNKGLSVLQSIDFLLYLKLVEDCPGFVDGSFNVQSNGFPRLQRICIHAPKLPKFSITEGGMRCLTSLHLICEDISGFSPDNIRRLKNIKEVGLATSVSTDTRKDWEVAAKQHKNRPEIHHICNEPPEIV